MSSLPRSTAALALAALAASSAAPADYVRVPGGLMHASCVHAAPADIPLDAATLPHCAHPFLRNGANSSHGAAWKAWAQSAPGGSVTSLSSEWAVPGEPIDPSSGQTLFFWNGAEPADTSAVLQPVLQWGTSAAGGGSYWAYASWYVSGAHGSHYSKVVKVKTGDVMTGSNVVDKATGNWNISSTAPGREPSVLIFKPVPGDWATAYHVLEAYGVSTVCDLYPAAGAVNFTNVAASWDGKPVSPIKWTAMMQTAGCGEHATFDAEGDAVEILFKTS
jgi:hypothetical protein